MLMSFQQSARRTISTQHHFVKYSEMCERKNLQNKPDTLHLKREKA